MKKQSVNDYVWSKMRSLFRIFSFAPGLIYKKILAKQSLARHCEHNKNGIYVRFAELIYPDHCLLPVCHKMEAASACEGH